MSASVFRLTKIIKPWKDGLRKQCIPALMGGSHQEHNHDLDTASKGIQINLVTRSLNSTPRCLANFREHFPHKRAKTRRMNYEM